VQRKWWKEGIVYQIYPWSFYDSDGDGIGDIRGIIGKLDYLAELGVGIVWLNPVYKSPNDDNGYDISDYQAIMDEFGTLADWEELLAGLHRRGIRLIMDLVINHTSDEHRWFIESRAAKDNSYRGYYIWRPGRDGKAPNNWRSFFSTSVWDYDAKTGEYYLHLYSPRMPGLNWENPALRQEMYTMMTWWLAKGVDGFRLDSANTISKVPSLPDAREDSPKYVRGREFFTNGPRMHEYFREMNAQVFSRYDAMTVGECSSADTEEALRMVGDDRGELSMIHFFEHDEVDWGAGGAWDIVSWKLTDLKRILSRWQTELHGRGWSGLFWENHDLPRSVSRYGDDREYREESAKLLITCLLTLQGTPYIYQGQEIGMTNIKFDRITDYRDIDTLNYYADEIAGGSDPAQIMANIHYRGRDNARTPMQWDASPNAGFTAGTPWLAVNPNYLEINVAVQRRDPDSVLNYYKRMIRLRKANAVLVYGDYTLLAADDEQVYAYLRRLEDKTVLVVLNFSRDPAVFNPPDNIDGGKTLLLANYVVPASEPSGAMSLRPYEARVYEIVE